MTFVGEFLLLFVAVSGQVCCLRSEKHQYQVGEAVGYREGAGLVSPGDRRMSNPLHHLNVRV